MARLRYVRAPVASTSSAPSSAGPRHHVRSLRAVYETEPNRGGALAPSARRGARAQISCSSRTSRCTSPKPSVVTVGAATVGVACSYEGRPGFYVLAMPMEGEFVVIGGREKYGEPKKRIAKTAFSLEADRVNAQVSRHGVTFLELDGRVGAPERAPLAFTEHFYCYKALPSCRPEADNGGFDGEVLSHALDVGA